MEHKILQILKDTFDLEDIDTSCCQDNCDAWDSMGQLNLVADLEDAFDITLEPEEIGTMKSFDDIITILKSKGIE